MLRSTLRVALVTVLAVLAGAMGGCGSEDGVLIPLDPALSAAPVSHSSASPAESGPSSGDWTVVASQKVNPGQVTVVQGSRYTLTFEKGALQRAVVITMSERDADIVDVKLDPDGITFSAPVTLAINYAGTVNDPLSPTYARVLPTVARFDTATGTWTLLQGVNDASTRTYTVQLTGFSRYAMIDGMSEPGPTGGHTPFQR